MGKLYLNTVPTLQGFTPQTTGPAGWSLIHGMISPFQSIDGGWHLFLNLTGSLTAASTFSVNITGIKFKNVSNFQQAVVAWDMSAATNTTYQAKCNPNASSITLTFANTTTRVGFSGLVELEEKPSFLP